MILLDTHVILMVALKPERLSKAAAQAVRRASAGDGVAISSISLWETAQLINAGRVTVHGSTEAFLNEVVRRPELAVFEISPEVAALSIQFPPDFTRDPADRIIAATARAHGLPLVTRDGSMQDSPLLRTIW